MFLPEPRQAAELLRTVDRQRLPEHGVDLTENRGARADADGEREDRGRREAWRLAHETGGEREVLAHALDPRGAPGLADVFLDQGDRSELPGRRRACLRSRKAGVHPI